MMLTSCSRTMESLPKRRASSLPRQKHVLVQLSLVHVLLVGLQVVDAESGLLQSIPSGSHVLHEAGRCSMYGICGARDDGKYLNCPENVPAKLPGDTFSKKVQSLCPTLTGKVCCSEDQFGVLRDQVKQAVPFLSGCPACLRNFLNFFCLMACSPDQSLFINVTGIANAASTGKPSVSSIEFFVDPSFGEQFYNSCGEVKFTAMNTRAMDFIGNGAQNYKEWFSFMGKQAEPFNPGSPFSIDFPTSAPPPFAPLSLPAAPCWDPLLSCSCGDCPASPACAPPPAPPSKTHGGCSVGFGPVKLKCYDALVLVGLLVYLALVPLHAWRSGAPPAGKGEAAAGLRDPLLSPGAAAGGADGGRGGGAADGGEGGEGQGSGGGAFAEIQPEPSETPGYSSLGCQTPAAHTLRDGFASWRDASFQDELEDWFCWQGRLIAGHPLATLAIALTVCACLAGGLAFLTVETRPDKLWVSPGSTAARQKAFYDENLGPFYRVEQLIFATQPASASASAPPIVTRENLDHMFSVQSKVAALRVQVDNQTLGLQDICFKPLGGECASETVLQYWQLNPDNMDNYGDVAHAEFCFQHFTSSEQCLGAFGGPVDPSVVLGGFSGSEFMKATSFVVTYPVQNYVNTGAKEYRAATAWEAAFITLAKEELIPMARALNLTLAFSSESSVEAELRRGSTADIATILVSYLVMFVYISFTLGNFSSDAPLFVKSKVALGLGGVLLVAVSVLAAMGLCSAAGVRSTLIIVEVIPFLVLAVGVDNMCILVHAALRQPRALPPAERVAVALGDVGPSITLASAAEALAFAVATLTPMPATRVFAMFAALAVVFDYLLQVTAFVALLALDLEREAKGRVDCLPCLTAAAEPEPEEEGGKALPVSPDNEPAMQRSLLNRFMGGVLVPLLERPVVRTVLLVFYGFTLFGSLALVPRLSPGLDQSIALPRDSYLQGYFTNITEFLHVGPPLYFVVKNYNYSEESDDTERLCSTGGCNPNSFLNQVSLASRDPLRSSIARPAASWLDDFLVWTSPDAFSCCREFPGGEYCPPDDQPPCCEDPSFGCGSSIVCANCTTCFLRHDMLGNRPATRDFAAKLPWFLDATPSADCAKGGKGAYRHSVNLTGSEGGVIRAMEFRTYHTPYKKQEDLIHCLRSARDFAARASQATKLEIFPYSVFYIFFEQYLAIWQTTLSSLLLASGAVFLTCLLFTGSFWASAVLFMALSSILLHLMAVMVLWGIQLNAVSAVNLVMSVGIGVEFCLHILHAFEVSEGSSERRASAALTKMGASVLSGITLTKFAGVAVLFFARSEIFEVYYFRMYLALVLLGAAHGLLLLPVYLSIWGQPKVPAKEFGSSLTPDLSAEILHKAMDHDVSTCRQQ